jgi:hypothetical protein
MKKHAAPIIAAILLLLPLLYVGSYLALVSPQGVTTPDPSDPYNYEGWIKNYRVGNSLCKQLFWPLEQIDRQLRPGAWDELQQFEKALQSYRRGGNLPEFSK